MTLWESCRKYVVREYLQIKLMMQIEVCHVDEVDKGDVDDNVMQRELIEVDVDDVCDVDQVDVGDVGFVKNAGDAVQMK